MNDMPPIEPIDEDDMELSQSPPGLPHQHRMELFSKIFGAMLPQVRPGLSTLPAPLMEARKEGNQ